jgi:DNA polymerase/3'-5' exonuclease PolX
MNIFDISIKNPKNKYILDEFIRYYEYIYVNQDLLDKKASEIYYKLLNIKRVIDVIQKYKNEINEDELTNIKKIKNIGPKTIDRFKEILKTGKLSEIQILESKQKAVDELTKIYGIGPKKAIELYKKNIKTIEDLLKSDIKLTSQQQVSIKYYKNTLEKIPRIEIMKVDIYFHDLFIKQDNNYIILLCGSYRREKDYSSDIDILITHKQLNNMDDCKKYLNEAIKLLKQKFIIDELQINGNNHFQGYAKIDKICKNTLYKDKFIRTDIIVVPLQSLFTALMHFTGSKSFNEKIRGLAKKKSYKLNEYGLYNNNEKPFIINSEKEIFDKLNIPYVNPKDRN